jgi:PBP1b-binding outer membrane lipoprotein LpoB
MKTPVSTALILLLVGCAQAPSIQQGPDAEVTFANGPGPDVLLIS